LHKSKINNTNSPAVLLYSRPISHNTKVFLDYANTQHNEYDSYRLLVVLYVVWVPCTLSLSAKRQY